MADPIAHNLHPSDIALEDTASYNQWFNAIVTLRDKAAEETDTVRAAQYTEAMHGIVSKMEQDLSDDTSVVSIGPLIDMWEVEGGGSFGSFAVQMKEEEDAAKLALIHSDSSGIDLSPEQKTQAIAGLDAKKKVLDDLQARSDEWDVVRTTAENNMTTLWNRYEAIKDTDPDKDWWAESRFVWWGLADPDNAIQEEIAVLGQEYRQQDAMRITSLQPTLQGAGPLPGQIDRAQTDYTSALEALNNLKE